MNRLLKPSSMLCLLLALAACTTKPRPSLDSVQPEAARPDTARPAVDPALATASRAEEFRAEGDRLQAQGRCRDALHHYGLAALEPGPGRSQTLASIYLCHWQLQRAQAAEESLSLFLRHELDQGRLPIKLLFQPGEARYLADARVSAPYGAWLRRIADAMLAGDSCLALRGHAGPSAVEQYSTGLALRRAQLVQRQLETLAPALKGRLHSQAAESVEPLIGSASDDLSDALDRRVDFALASC
jgi:outer membrane protein OmpA-like peptidoglycan-associated protein